VLLSGWQQLLMLVVLCYGDLLQWIGWVLGQHVWLLRLAED
jgi:hypothetical protein